MRNYHPHRYPPHTLELGRLRIGVRSGPRHGHWVWRGLDSGITLIPARGTAHHDWYNDCLEKVKSLIGDPGCRCPRIFTRRLLREDRGTLSLHFYKRRLLSEITQVNSSAHDEELKETELYASRPIDFENMGYAATARPTANNQMFMCSKWRINSVPSCSWWQVNWGCKFSVSLKVSPGLEEYDRLILRSMLSK